MPEPRQPVTLESLLAWTEEATRERIALEAQFASSLETDQASAFDSMTELALEAIKAVQLVAATKREHDERPG